MFKMDFSDLSWLIENLDRDVEVPQCYLTDPIACLLHEIQLYPQKRTISKNLLNRWVINDCIKDINVALNQKGDTLLHLAVRFNKQNLIKWMVRNKGADVNQWNKMGITPLHASILYGNQAVTHILLKLKADLEIADLKGENSLHAAARSLPVPHLRSILEYCDEKIINTSSKSHKCPLHYLMENKYANLEAVQLFVSKGACINSNGEPMEKKAETFEDYFAPVKVIWQGGSPLHYFIHIKSSNMALLHGLLECGANVNGVNRYGNTALNLVDIDKYTIDPSARLLLIYGADVNLANCIGQSPFNNALNNNCLKYVKLYLHYGANVNILDDLGNTPLHSVAPTDNDTMVKLLLQYGADINIRNIYGYTPYPVSYPEDFQCDHCKAVFVTFTKHILALSMANKYVCMHNLDILKYEARWAGVWEECNEQCAHELELLRKHVIDGTNISLKFISELNYIGGRSCNENLVRGLQKENIRKFKDYYPIFYPILRRNIRRILHLNRLNDLITTVSSDFKLLPIVCVDKILDYLDNEDVTTFIKAFPGADYDSFCDCV